MTAASRRGRPSPSLCTHGGWTDERTELAQELWVGGSSAGEIAKQLGGVSRSAVLGRLHRTLPKDVRRRVVPSTPRKAPTLPKVETQRRVPPKPVSVPAMISPEPVLNAAAFEPLPGSRPRVWTERKFGECTWPVGGRGADTLSCCEPVSERGWCKRHNAEERARLQARCVKAPSRKELARSLCRHIAA